jgi:hypothetical protein
VAGERVGPIARFYAHNVPRIGLAHPMVMHLVYAVAGHHMLWLKRQHTSAAAPAAAPTATQAPPPPTPARGLGMDISRSLSLGDGAPALMYPDDAHYAALLAQHGAAGMAQLSDALKSVGEDNCGAAHLGTIIVCIWTFAAGPTGPDDLLVCHVDPAPSAGKGGPPPPGAAAAAASSSSWPHEHARAFPMIHGVRITRSAFPPEVLFRGLMAPMNTPREEDEAEKALDVRLAMWEKTGFARVDWQAYLDSLAEFLAHECPPAAAAAAGRGHYDAAAYDEDAADVHAHLMHSLAMLSKVYAANLGADAPPHRSREDPQFAHVLGWLYRLPDGFVALVRRRDPGALVVLAHFALLLRTLRAAWWLDGWAEHLVARIAEMLTRGERGAYASWLDWVVDKMGGEGGSL